MKPTQQEIIWVALRAGLDLQVADKHCREPYWTATMPELQKLVELALESFSAGGGEPVMVVEVEGGCWNTTKSLNFFGIPDGTYSLYTHPSPTDLRAEYLRGLEDAKKIAGNYGPSRPIVTKTPSQRIVGRWEGEQAASAGIADAIETLKGKQ